MGNCKAIIVHCSDAISGSKSRGVESEFTMTRRSSDFLVDWLRKNISPRKSESTDARLVFDLTHNCLAKAAIRGITRAEIEEDVGSLEICI